MSQSPPRALTHYEVQGGYTLTSQERAYTHFQIVSFLIKEVLAQDIYTRDELRAYCACAMLFAKTNRSQSWECCDHMFGFILRFYCVESIHLNIELCCVCMKAIQNLVVLLNKKS